MGGARVRDDAGGVWIVTGWVLGCIVYAGVVLSWHAGFTAALPFVVIPPLLVVMIGVGNLVSGRRAHRPPPRFHRPDLAAVPPGDAPGAPGPGAAPGPTAGGAPDGGSGTPA
jgi:hypothetical protein